MKIVSKEEIEYDKNNVINPISIGNKKLTYEARMLKAINEEIKYKYNEEEIRIEKEVGGIKTEYEVIEGKILREKTNEGVIIYHYDERGIIVGFEYKNKQYYYIKDILGIIEEIVDEEGRTMVSYKYDAWGQIIKEVRKEEEIGRINNIVYKGYYLDKETGWYYLNSRYYNPKIGRFINGDDYNYLDINEVGSLNLFAYCNNNPVMYFDPSGNMPEWLKWTIGIGIIVGLGVATVLTGGAAAAILGGAFLGASVGGGVGLISGVSFDENGFHFDSNKASTGFMFGSITGAISGAIGAKVGAIAKLGAFGQRAIMAGVDGTLSLGAYLGQTAIHREKISLGGALISFGSGLFSFADPTGYKVLDAIWGPIMGAEIAWVYDLFSGKGQKTNVATKKLIPYL